jgi:hypothetical protein
MAETAAPLSLTSMLYWEDPMLTGPIFGSVLVVLVSLASCSLLSVASYTALLLLTAVAVAKVAAFVMVKAGKVEEGFDPLAKVAAVSLSVPEDIITAHAPCLTAAINTALARAKALFLLTNPVDTLKFGLTLYLLTFLGAWFNALTLVTLAWVAAFTLPKLYLNNQSAVDEVVAKVAGQVEEVRAKVVEALPAAMKPPVVKKEE